MKDQMLRSSDDEARELSTPSQDSKDMQPDQQIEQKGQQSSAKDSSRTPAHQRAERAMKGAKWCLAVVAVFSTNFLFALDNTIVADIQPAILRDLGEVNKLPWISVSFPLAAASTNLLWGRLFSQFEIKRSYLTAIVVFQVGSAICGAAQSMNMLIAARVVAGIGCQGMYIGVMTLIGSMTTARERPLYISTGGVVWGLGTVLGPVIGAGFTSSSATWRWSFYINLCLGAVFAPVYFWVLPSISLAQDATFGKKLRGLDFIGAILLIAATTLVVLAIDFGGIVLPWRSGPVIAFFVVSGVLLTVLGFQQYLQVFTSRQTRIVPFELLRSRDLLILCLQTIGATAAGLVPIYFLPLYFQFVQAATPLRAAAYLLPLIVFLVVSCFLSGAMVSKNGRYVPWFILGSVCSICGSSLLYTIRSRTSTSAIYGYSILLGIGAGVAMQLPFSIFQAKVKPQELALANGLISQAQVAGLCIALAVANAVFLNVAIDRVSEILPDSSRAQVQSLVSGTSGNAFSTIPPQQRALILQAIIEALRNVYLVVLTLSSLTLLSCFVLKWEKLPMEEKNSEEAT